MSHRSVWNRWAGRSLAILLFASASWTDNRKVPEGPDELQAATVKGHALRPQKKEFDPSLLQRIKLPPEFQIRVFADHLENPRMIAVGDDGTVYISERSAGRVRALRDADGDGSAEDSRMVVEGLEDVHGLEIHGGNLYMATIKELYRAPVHQDGAIGKPERLIADLPDGGQHPNRTIAFGPDGNLYVSIGSSCNNCKETNKEHATLVRANADGSQRSIYAEGLRNTIGFGWHPRTGELWGMDHGSDWRGDDTPPEELNRISEAKHYGWPFCYGARQPDMMQTQNPGPKTTKAEFCRQTTAPELTYQAHSAPIAMVFYDGASFPQEFRGDAFVAMRGSWNRKPPVGYKIVRLRFDSAGQPKAFEDFASGWLLDDKSHFGRPAGLAVSKNGSLLVTDDSNGMVYEITYAGKR